MGIIASLALCGCASEEVKQLHMRDSAGTTKTVEFPVGTMGIASSGQASVLAQLFVDSHNMSMNELSEIKGGTRKIEESLQKLNGTTREILATSKNNAEIAQKSLHLLEQLVKKQGTGEITLFFQSGSDEIKQGTLEYERAVNFADFLSRESRGRKILFISIGSSSAFGNKKVNEKHAMKRSSAPLDIIDKYLVNIPHEFFKVYGTGDIYSPKNATMKEHQRYQHARIIAFYETDQIPTLPNELKAD